MLNIFCCGIVFLKISNSIAEETSILKEDLVDELDYVLLPKEGFEKLSSWYGTVNGQVQYLAHQFCILVESKNDTENFC